MSEPLSPVKLTLLIITFGPPDNTGSGLFDSAKNEQFVETVIKNHKGLLFYRQENEYRLAFLDPAQALAALLDLQEQSRQHPDLKLGIRLAFDLGTPEPVSQVAPATSQNSEFSWQGRLIEHENWLLRLISFQGRPIVSKAPPVRFEIELLALLRGQFLVAQNWLRQNVLAAQQNDNPTGQSLGLALWALVRLRQGEVETARSLIEESLAQARLVQDKVARRLALHIAVLVAQQAEQPEETVALEQQRRQVEQELSELQNQIALLNSLAKTARLQGELPTAYNLFRQSLTLALETGDGLEKLRAMCNLADAAFACRQYDEAARLLDDSLDAYNRLNHEPFLAALTCAIGHLLAEAGDLAGAELALNHSLALSQSRAQRHIVSSIVLELAHLNRAWGDLASARRLYQESLAAAWETTNHFNLAAALVELADLNLAQEQPRQARLLYEKGFSISLRTANRAVQARCLENLAGWCVRQGQPRRAVWLLSAAQALREKLKVNLSARLETELARQADSLRAQLGPKLYKQAWQKGASLVPAQAFHRAWGKERTPTRSTTPAPARLVPETTLERQVALSNREIEILNLLAMGLTNAQIAEHLSLSPYTVGSYLRALYTKLDVTSRTAAAAYALKHRLVLE